MTSLARVLVVVFAGLVLAIVAAIGLSVVTRITTTGP